MKTLLLLVTATSSLFLSSCACMKGGSCCSDGTTMACCADGPCANCKMTKKDGTTAHSHTDTKKTP